MPLASMAAYARRKREVLGGLAGPVLEIGAGRGANFAHLAAGVSWIGLEPHPRSRARLARTAAAYGHHTPVLAAPAEAIPLPDDAVASVVATVVLCSVADQARALAEIRRVLRPGGSFAFFEHVAAAPGTVSRRLQRLWAPVSRRFDTGCDPSRPTWRAIRAAGFEAVDLQWFGRQRGVYGTFIAGQAFEGSS